MGNAVSGTTGECLVTASMAKYMTITKPQVMTLRNAVVAPKTHSTSQPPQSPQRRHGSIKRANLQHALQEAGVPELPDREVLDLLFTLWDMTGSGRVARVEFIVGLSVLACKDDSIETALRFALQVADTNRTGKISSKDASAFLRSICATATYFGDRPLALRQIYKIVDTIFVMSPDVTTDAGDEHMEHGEFVRLLTEQESVQDVVCVKGKRPQKLAKRSEMVAPAPAATTERQLVTTTTTPTPSPTITITQTPAPPPPTSVKSALDRLQEKFKQDENNLETVCSNSLLETIGEAEQQTDGQEEESDEDDDDEEDAEKSQSAVSANYSTDFSSHMSLKLTPLTKITISSNNSQSSPPQQPKQTLQTLQPTMQKSSRQVLLIPWIKSKSIQA